MSASPIVRPLTSLTSGYLCGVAVAGCAWLVLQWLGWAQAPVRAALLLVGIGLLPAFVSLIGSRANLFPRSRPRPFLRADVIFYVRPDGDDTNDGLVDSPGRAFATPQRAINIIYRLDMRGFEARVQLAHGEYEGRITIYGPPTGARHRRGRPIRLLGDEENPAAVVIRCNHNAAVELGRFADLLVAGITFENHAPEGDLWLVKSGARLDHRNCILGTATGDKIRATHHAAVRALGPLTVAGNGLSFVHATSSSEVEFADRLISFIGAPEFSKYIWGINNAAVNISGGVIEGRVIGAGLVYCNGLLNVSRVKGSYRGGGPFIVQDGGVVVDRHEHRQLVLWVRSEDGNDHNDGRLATADRAFRTIQGAIDALARMDRTTVESAHRAAASVIINLHGAFEETVRLRDIGYPEGAIIGDKTSPASVVVMGECDAFVSAGSVTRWTIRSLTTLARGGSCMHAANGGQIAFRDVRFGDAGLAHLCADQGGRIYASGAYQICGNAPLHVLCRLNAIVDSRGRSVELVGTPSFGSTFARVELNGVYRCDRMTFAGSAKGRKYHVSEGGVIHAKAATTEYLPGDKPGQVEAGGFYS